MGNQSRSWGNSGGGGLTIVICGTSYVSASLRREVAARADGVCEYCLIHESDAYLGC